jgi:hypothetical protein
MQVPNYFQILSDRLSNIEALLIDIKHRPQTPPNAAPTKRLGSFKDLLALTGWPASTARAKTAIMPDGCVIRGRSKRLVYDLEAVEKWLKTPVQP